ncbi:MAG: metallophosphoesterase [Pseudomonadota bacterium]
MPLFKRLFGKAPPPPPAFDAPLRPNQPAFIIGDLHGCLRQMQDLQAQMQTKDPDALQIYVGDYVDRGDHSKDVLDTLYARRDDPQIICLRGNHEDMLLRFLEEPATKGARWIRYGGLNTLGSYGISGIPPNSEGAILEETAAKLKEAMGLHLIHWLSTLPTTWTSGNLTVVHAGADPALPMALQAEQTLKWGHPDFLSTPRSDGHWIAHGHTIVDEATAADGRIAVDTGAYATGRLTAAYVTPTTLEFLQAG